MKLEGAKINFLGDSITEGVGTTAPDKVYHQLIKEKYGLEYAYNYGVSGTRIARQTIPTKDALMFDLAFGVRAEVMERGVDAVVVFGGTNDYGHGDAHFGDMDSEDEWTFCGAVNTLISKLKKDFPSAEIIFMTPLHRSDVTTPTAPDFKVLSDYADALREICKKRGVKVIDLFKINPIDPQDAELIPDGVHPSDKGHIILAEVVGKALMEI